MTPADYVNSTYPGPISIPLLGKIAGPGGSECDWTACARPNYSITTGEHYLEWKGIRFCQDCWEAKS